MTSAHVTLLTTRTALGALAFILGGVQYVVLEAIAATAWAEPRYSYLANYISDLGVTVAQIYDGRLVGSPLAWVMNAGFVIEGMFFIAGAVLLADMFGVRVRVIFVWFAVLHGVGIVLVGFFDETATIELLHLGGAYLSIVFGNATALVVGLSLLVFESGRRLGLPRWFGIVSIVLPVVGLLSEAVLVLGLSGESFDGLWERGGVYSITVWEIFFGVVVLRHLRRIRRGRSAGGSESSF